MRVIGAAHGLEARIERALGEVGLSMAKFGVLSRLVEAGEPLTLSALADRCSCVRSNITQLIDRLQHEKLVERVADPTDRRSIRASLTRLGRETFERGEQAFQQAELHALDGLSADDRSELLRLAQLLENA